MQDCKIHQRRRECSDQTYNLPGESTYYNWNSTRGTETNHIVKPLFQINIRLEI